MVTMEPHNGHQRKRQRLTSTNDRTLHCLRAWHEDEEAAEQMIPVIGSIYRDHTVITHMYGKSLRAAGPVEIMQVHAAVKKDFSVRVSALHSLAVLNAIKELPLVPSRIDIGRIVDSLGEAVDAEMRDSTDRTLMSTIYRRLLQPQLEEFTETNKEVIQDLTTREGRDVVLYGFGRIGRLVLRLLITKVGAGNKLVPRAIVVRDKGLGVEADLHKRASLLMTDSVHGPFQGTLDVDVKGSALIINGIFVKVIYSQGPDKVDYTQYGIENGLVVDNTGIWRDRKGLGLHLKSKGISQVVLTAPAKGADIPCVVMGINHHDLDVSESIISAASCTTNAIVPPLKIVDDAYGIESGHIETVHSFTNDQNLIDNFHKKERRGRAAPLNMVLTETGAGKAVVKVLPHMQGKLTANAIRVPTPNVSLAVLCLTVRNDQTKDDVNALIRDKSLRSDLRNQIELSTSVEFASSDVVGNRHPAVVDGPNTIVNGNKINLYVWYDNEYGYSCQVVRLLQHVCTLNHPRFPKAK